jgi:hypothetical protein
MEYTFNYPCCSRRFSCDLEFVLEKNDTLDIESQKIVSFTKIKAKSTETFSALSLSTNRSSLTLRPLLFGKDLDASFEVSPSI